MDLFENERQGMIWGFRCCLWASFLGMFWISCGWIYAACWRYKNYSVFQDEREQGKSPFDYDDNELTLIELKKEMFKRRIHSYSF
mmetsp:Transcript_15936/g.15350  ORF Transcript_15936/g.15350 Transcript_15936/m.15350 type:complete len:85 (+) Transcript_15936:1003-1257(+)